jgi:hypothetical protein
MTVWLNKHPLSPVQIDCAVAVMLKILDGKCKMPAAEKRVMTLLYDQIKTQPGQLLDNELHTLIAAGRVQPENHDLKMQIYEKRLLAETVISRPVMKQFKAFIREQGLLDHAEESDDKNSVSNAAKVSELYVLRQHPNTRRQNSRIQADGVIIA